LMLSQVQRGRLHTHKNLPL